jgi:hypothetical protein
VKEGNGALEVVFPSFRFPIGRSSFALLSTLNMVVSSKIWNLGSEAHLCLPFIERMLKPLKGDMRGEHACP